MILVDTSVWIEHLRKPHARFSALLEEGRVATHPFVIGEIACGNLMNRKAVLDLLRDLPSVPAALDSEVLELIERRAFAGRGIGFVDAHLLTAAILAPVPFWTFDRRLADLAASVGAAFNDRA